MTFGALNSASNQLARAILHSVEGSNPNTDGDYIVAVCLPPSDNLITTLLAIWKAGAAYLALDSSFPPSRVEHIIREARPVLVITEKGQYQEHINQKVLNSEEKIHISPKKPSSNQILYENMKYV